ncbi:pepsin/retropepsin-like aspartic protease family protein [Paenibacillus alvei]
MNSINLLVIKDEEISDFETLFVKASIDGKEHRFQLDKGSNQTIMLEDDSLASYQKNEANDYIGAFSEHQIESISVSSIRVGPISKVDFEVASIKDETGTFTNILGIDFFLEHKCYFRFDQSQIVIDSPLEEGEDILFHHINSDNSLPFIEGILNGMKVHALWDTGANINVVDSSLINSYPEMFQEIDGKALASGLSETNTEIPIYYMEAIEIGGHVFQKQLVAATDLSHFIEHMEQPIQLIIGYNTISNANWIFDFPNSKWAILSND